MFQTAIIVLKNLSTIFINRTIIHTIKTVGVLTLMNYKLSLFNTIHIHILGIDSQVGSLETGKDADIVVYDGNPMEVASVLELVLIDGNKVN